VRKVLWLFVALSVLGAPLVTAAQTAPPPAPSVAGQWIMSIKVTKGNEKDPSRIGSGGTMKCAQNGASVICRGEGSNILDGELNGTNLSLSGEWLVESGSIAALYCFYYSCTIRSRARAYKVKMHFDGDLVSDGLLEGKWTAVLLVGLGRYDVEGTWKAIKS
jgi:hypothetical protein